MASISNTTNYTFCFKGVASSVEDLPSYNNYIGDYFVVENNVGFQHYFTFVWTGKNWTQFEATEENMKPYNELKSKSFDTILKEDYDKNFENNLKKLEQQTKSLEFKEQYNIDIKTVLDKNQIRKELSDRINPRYMDSDIWDSYIKEIPITDSIGDCISDIYKQANITLERSC